MDDQDKELLNLLQKGLPLCHRPFQELARQLGLEEEDVLSRLQAMKEDGTIRRMGGVFDSGALGFVSVLCALAVPEENVEGAVQAINRCSGVTHNYLRDHAYNIWFTAIAPGKEQLDQMIEQLRQDVGADLYCLPAIQKFKVDARFML